MMNIKKLFAAAFCITSILLVVPVQAEYNPDEPSYTLSGKGTTSDPYVINLTKRLIRKMKI